MTTGRTHDLVHGLDTGAAWVELPNAMSATIGGDATVTAESYLGSSYSEHTCQSVGRSVTLDSIVQTAGFETLAGLAASSPRSRSRYLALAPVAPASWEIIPVSWPRSSYGAANDDSIMRSWNLAGTGVGWSGTEISSFSRTSAGSIKGSINAARGGIIFILLTSTGGSSDIDFSGTSNAFTGLPSNVARTGIFGPITVAGSGRSISIGTLTGRRTAVTGYVLQGRANYSPGTV